MVNGMNTFGENVTRVPKRASRIRAAARSSSSSGAPITSRVSITDVLPSGGDPAADAAGRHGLVAVPAHEGLVERLAARVVHEHDGRLTAGDVLVAPALERDQGR